jgi:two-component system phosphate regulon sensor histidine kinase PhoR
VIGDVTKLRKLESLRRDFVANVSHELKTPLTSIKGFIETLLDGALDEREIAVKFLSIIYQETERLNNLIHDLLDISKLESGAGEIKKKSIKLDQLIDEILLTLNNRMSDKNIELTKDFAAKLIIGDEDLLKEVFLNLIDNAIKYTQAGGKISVGSRNVKGGTLIYVKDNGYGIPADSLPRIFERFYRVDKGRSREMGGTGLGLSIVKHIIERHNGKVTVESELGKGSQFSVVIPNKGKPEADMGETE